MELVSLLGLLLYVLMPMALIAGAFDNDYECVGFVCIALWVGLLLAVGGVHWWLGLGYFILTNPAVLLKWALYYVGVAIVWAFVKWVIKGRDELKRYREKEVDIKARWEKGKDEVYRGYTYAQWVSSEYNFPPKANHHKSDITGWMAFWPFSMLATFLGDFLGRFFKAIYDYLASSFDKVMGLIWKGTDLNPGN